MARRFGKDESSELLKQQNFRFQWLLNKLLFEFWLHIQEGNSLTKSLKAFVDQQASVILTEEERMGLPTSNSKDSSTDAHGAHKTEL